MNPRFESLVSISESGGFRAAARRALAAMVLVSPGRGPRDWIGTVEVSRLEEQPATIYEHPRWDDVTSRCLTCANCTLVCPTCFCSTVEDTTDLTGRHTERWRSWDSCFTLDFSQVGAGPVRASGRSRYRQSLSDAGSEVIPILEYDVHPVAALAAVTRARQAGFVVVGTRGLGGFTGLRLGRVPLQLLHQVTVPVVMVPPHWA